MLRVQHRLDEMRTSFAEAEELVKLAQPRLKRWFYQLVEFFTALFTRSETYDLSRKRRQGKSRQGKGLGKTKDQGGSVGGNNHG